MPDVTHIWSTNANDATVVDFTGSGLAAGDLLIVALCLFDHTADQGVSSGPADWFRVGLGSVTTVYGDYLRIDLYYKLASGNEITVPFTVTGWLWGQSSASVYRNVNQITPIEALNGSNDWVLPSLTLVGGRDLLVGIFGTTGGQGPYTLPPELTQRTFNNSLTSSSPMIWVGDIQLTSAGNSLGYAAVTGGGLPVLDWVIALTPSAGFGLVSHELRIGSLPVPLPSVYVSNTITAAATNLTIAAATVGSPALAMKGKSDLVASNLSAGAATPGVATLTKYAIPLAPLSVSPPVLASPTLTQIIGFFTGTHVIDFGLNDFVNATAIHLCSRAILVYADVASSTLANKASPTFTGLSNAQPDGRQIATTEIIDGVVTASGRAVAFAIVDAINGRLMATGPLYVPVDLLVGRSFSMSSIRIKYPATSAGGTFASPLVVGMPIIGSPAFVIASPGLGITHGQQIRTGINTGRAGAAAANVAGYSSTLTTQSGNVTYTTNQTIRNVNFTGQVFVRGGNVTFEFCRFSVQPPSAATGEGSALHQFNNGAACGTVTCNWCEFDSGLRGGQGNYETCGFQVGDRGTLTANVGSAFTLYRCSIQGFGNGIGLHRWQRNGLSRITECFIGNLTTGGTPADHQDGIEYYSTDNVIISLCRIEVTGNAFGQSCVNIAPTGADAFPNVGNPITVQDCYLNGCIAAVLCSWVSSETPSSTAIHNVSFINNYFGDLTYWGSECNFDSMNVTFEQAYATAHPEVIYWATSNIWAPDGEGVTNPATSVSGDPVMGKPHNPGEFVSEANFYAGAGAWNGQVLSGGGGGAVPVVTPANFEVATGIGLDALIGPMSATNSPTSWAIASGNSSGYFAIYVSGNLRTSDTIPVPDGLYNLTITASNSSGTSDPAAVGVQVGAGSVRALTAANLTTAAPTVPVLNLNGILAPVAPTIPAPVLGTPSLYLPGAGPTVAPQSFTFGVPAEPSQLIGTVLTGGGTPTSFSITAGNSSGLFAIDSTGKLTGNANVAIYSSYSNGLKPQAYNLTVRATNASGYGEGTITVNCQRLPWPALANRPAYSGGTLTWTGPAAGGPSCWDDAQQSHALTTSSITQSSSNGQVLEYLDLGSFSFMHNNVTVRRCRIRGTVQSTTGVAVDGTGGTRPTGEVLEDCDLLGIDGAVGYVSNITVRRCRLHGSVNSITATQRNEVVKDCIFDTPTGAADDHVDQMEIYTEGSASWQTNNITICNNTFTGPIVGGLGGWACMINLTNWSYYGAGNIGPNVFVDANRFWKDAASPGFVFFVNDASQGSGSLQWHATNNGFYPTGEPVDRGQNPGGTILTNSGNYYMATPTAQTGTLINSGTGAI